MDVFPPNMKIVSVPRFKQLDTLSIGQSFQLFRSWLHRFMCNLNGFKMVEKDCSTARDGTYFILLSQFIVKSASEKS